MPQVSREALSKGILGVFAVSLMFSAAQIASGRDLSSISLVSTSQVSLSSADIGINREAKADRAAVASASAGRMQTISLRLDGLSDTSLPIRLLVAADWVVATSLPRVLYQERHRRLLDVY